MIPDHTAGPIALDTSVFIYYLEEHGFYAPLLAPLFEAASSGKVELHTSELTLLELTVLPLARGDESLADEYEAILRGGEGLTLLPIDLDIVRMAARLRAGTRLKTPDAIHLASAVVEGAGTFFTNDHRLPTEVAGVRVAKLPRTSGEVHEPR